MQTIVDMMEVIKYNFNYFSLYMFPAVYLLIALFYLLLCGRRMHMNFVYLCLMVVLLWFSPFAANNIGRFFLGSSMAYGNILFAVPVIGFCAYAIVQLTEHEMKNYRVLFGIFVIVLLQAGYRFDYNFDSIQRGINLTKVDPEVVELNEMFETFDAKCLAPEEVASQLREYSLATSVLYGNYSYDSTDLEEMVKLADTYDCNAIVVNKEDDDADYLEKEHFQKLGETEHYLLYVYLKHK